MSRLIKSPDSTPDSFSPVYAVIYPKIILTSRKDCWRAIKIGSKSDGTQASFSFNKIALEPFLISSGFSSW